MIPAPPCEGEAPAKRVRELNRGSRTRASKLQIKRHPDINREEVDLEIAARRALRALLHLVCLLVGPLEVEAHHADRYLHGRPVGDEGRHARGETDLQVLHRLVRPVVRRPRAGRVLPLAVAIRQPRLVEEAEYLAPPDGDVGPEETGRLVLVLQVIKVVEREGDVTQVRVEILQVQIVAIVGETEARRDVVAEEITYVWADAEIIATSLDIFQDKEIEVLLVVLRIGYGAACHPGPLGDEYLLLHLAVDALYAPLAPLSHRLACPQETECDEACQTTCSHKSLYPHVHFIFLRVFPPRRRPGSPGPSARWDRSVVPRRRRPSPRPSWRAACRPSAPA